MNEAWQLLGIVAVLGCCAWLTRALAGRLALKKLQQVASHRLKLEQCWLLIGQIPDAQLSAETRKALGRILKHHLAHSRRSGINESAQELRIARLVGHAPKALMSNRPSEALAQTLRRLISLLDAGLSERVLSVSMHIHAHDHLYSHLAAVEQALSQRKAHIEELLYLPFGQRNAART